MPIAAHPLNSFVAALELRSPMSESDRSALLDLPFSLRTLEKSSYILREADIPINCGTLVSGYAFRHKTTYSGGRQLLSILLPGDAFDLQNLYLNASDHSIQMMTRGDVALIDRRLLNDLAATRPAIQLAIFIKVLAEAAMFREWILNIGRRSAEERIAHLLCEIATRQQAKEPRLIDTFQLPISQEELADAAGITPIHVGRILKKLSTLGLVSRGRQSLEYSDLEGLGRLADFNPSYLHLRHDRMP